MKNNVLDFFEMNNKPQKPRKICHKHKTCQALYNHPEIQAKLRAGRGIGVAIVVYLHWFLNLLQPVILFGKEKHGKYQNEYNLPSGGMDKKDKGCFLRAALRELYEETGVWIDRNTFDSHFKHTGVVRFIVHHGTPVFICKFNGLKRGALNRTLTSWSKDHSKPHCYKEVWRVDFFDPSTLNQWDGKQSDGYSNFQVSSFAASVVGKVVQQGYLNQ